MPDGPINRRQFFRGGFFELLKPLVKAIEPLEAAARQFGIEDPPRRVSVTQFLRPPGALAEEAFADKCSRCGDCVRSCPVQCIQLDSTVEHGGGLPFIVADTAACAVCSGLNCMHACPTGALKIVPLVEIDMGTAEWQIDTCVRQRGEACTICVDHCPLGAVAIELSGKRIRVHEEGCIGCGICQHDCPTSPKSIVVRASQ